MNYCYYLLLCLVVIFYRAFSFTCLALMQIYWNKGKRLHKKRVQLLHDWFGTPTKIGRTIPSQTPVLSKNDQKPIIALFSLMKESFDYLYLRLLRLEKLLSWLVPRPLSIDINLCAKEGGKKKTGETLSPLLSLPFPWSLALRNQSLTFRARLCSQQKCEKRSAPSG